MTRQMQDSQLQITEVDHLVIEELARRGCGGEAIVVGQEPRGPRGDQQFGEFVVEAELLAEPGALE